MNSHAYDVWFQSLFRMIMGYAAWVNWLIQQTLSSSWVSHDESDMMLSAEVVVVVMKTCNSDPLLWEHGGMTAAVAAPLDVPLRLCWVHTFGGLLPALWRYCCCLCDAGLHQQWLWPQGLSISLARSFSELLCDLRLCLPNFPSSFFHRSRTYISLSSLFSLSPAPSPDSFTGISPVSLLNFQSCLRFGGPKPTYLGFELLII